MSFFLGLSRCKPHFASNPVFVYTSINIRKMKFIAYIYIPVSQNLVKQSYVSAKIEAVKHLHEVFLQTEEQQPRPIKL